MLGRLLKRDNETTGITIQDWAKMFRPGAQVNYGGHPYQAFQLNAKSNGQAVGQNSVVFACEANRLLLFAEARFQFQQMRNGRPGDLFGTADLGVLEVPWAGHTTRDLLARAELDVAGHGQSYWVRDRDGFARIDPSIMTLLTESVTDWRLTGNRIGERLLAYIVKPTKDPKDWTTFLPEEVAHYKPYPDPENQFLGMSWLSPCLPDVDVDTALTQHKEATVRNGASLQTIVSFDPLINKEQFDAWVSRFRENHERPENAGKTLFLGGGADVKTVSQTFENLALKATQGAGETRIAACAGMPPVIVGLSEGLAAATYSNYGQARRRLADGTMRPLWGAFASTFASLVPAPGGSRLWYDVEHVAFLREDAKDQADILQVNSSTIAALIAGGYKPDAAVDAVESGDLSRLAGEHTGLYSVQLQPPSSGTINEPTPAPTPAGA